MTLDTLVIGCACGYLCVRCCLFIGWIVREERRLQTMTQGTTFKSDFPAALMIQFMGGTAAFLALTAVSMVYQAFTHAKPPRWYWGADGVLLLYMTLIGLIMGINLRRMIARKTTESAALLAEARRKAEEGRQEMGEEAYQAVRQQLDASEKQLQQMTGRALPWWRRGRNRAG